MKDELDKTKNELFERLAKKITLSRNNSKLERFKDNIKDTFPKVELN